jgi:pre-mRNA-splicing factor SYF1
MINLATSLITSTSLLQVFFHPIKEEDDLAYEEEILRNPYSVKCWSRYLEHKKSAPKSVLNLVYERALKELPGR